MYASNMKKLVCIIVLVISSNIISVTEACSYVLSGKTASADGSVIASYQNDYTGNTPFAVIPVPSKSPELATPLRPSCRNAIVPAVPSSGTYSGMLVATPAIREAFLNSAGLGMNYGVYNYVRYDAISADPFSSNGLNTEFWDLAFERCATPRCVIQLLSGLMAECGASNMIGGGSIGVFNKNEAWTIEILSGHHFVAKRVPDNKYLAQPNLIRVGIVDFNDNNFITSTGLLQFARSMGAIGATETILDLAKAFNRNEGAGVPCARDRLYLMTRLISNEVPRVTLPPTFATPSVAITPAILRAVHRDHGEGTQFDRSGPAYINGSPHNMESSDPTFCPTCRGITTYHIVWRFPRRGPAVMMVGAGSGCLGGMVPYWAETAGYFANISSSTASNMLDLAVEDLRLIQLKMDATNNGHEEQLAYHDHIGSVKSRQAVLDMSLDEAITDTTSSPYTVQSLATLTASFSARVKNFVATTLAEVN